MDQQRAQTPPGPHVPEHDRPAIINPVPRDHDSLRQWVEHIKWAFRHPERDVPGYREAKERLEGMSELTMCGEIESLRASLAAITAERDALREACQEMKNYATYTLGELWLPPAPENPYEVALDALKNIQSVGSLALSPGSRGDEKG